MSTNTRNTRKTCCYEKKQGCCCVPISNATCAYLFHLTIHGGVIGLYVFTTRAYPPLYYVDYAFAGTALSLSGLSFFSMFFIKARRYQCWRSFLGLLLFFGILSNIALTIWYSVERWHSDMRTLLFRGIRRLFKSGDPFWYFWLVCCWIVALLSIYYLICIISCFCNTYKTYLFTDDYIHAFDENLPDTSLEVSRYTSRFNENRPYPVQKY